jgi:hypothetical protein
MASSRCSGRRLPTRTIHNVRYTQRFECTKRCDATVNGYAPRRGSICNCAAASISVRWWCVLSRLRMHDFEAWLASNGRSPAEMILKTNLRELPCRQPFSRILTASVVARPLPTAEPKIVDKRFFQPRQLRCAGSPRRLCPWVPDRSSYFFAQVSSSVFFQAPPI